MNRRLRIKLVDPTPERWLKFKGIQNLIAAQAAKYNIELSDLVYDEQLYIKSISYSHDLTCDYLSSEDLSGTRAIIDQLKQSLNVNHA